MKPNWKDAPEWANYLAMDEGGSWYWYEIKPTFTQLNDDNIWYISDGRYELYNPIIDAINTLESR